MKRLSALVILNIFAFSLFGQPAQITPIIPNPFNCVTLDQLYFSEINLNPAVFFSDASIKVVLEHGTNPGSSKSVMAGTSSRFDANGQFAPIRINEITYQNTISPTNNQISDDGFRNLFFSTGCLPPGYYNVTLNFCNSSGSIISTASYPLIIQQSSPLLLVSPFNESKVDSDLPLFSWTSVQPFNAEASYLIEVVQVLAPQSPFEALRSNPIYFRQEGLMTNMIQYPVASRSFAPCATYAWRVKYGLNNKMTLSESEIWTFKTKCDGTEEDEEDNTTVIGGISNLKPFHELKTQQKGHYYKITDYRIRFMVKNNYKELAELSVEIKDYKGETVLDNIAPLNMIESTEEEEVFSAVPGYVTYMLNIEGGKLKEGSYYTMVVNGLRIPYYLRIYLETEDVEN